MAGRARLSSDKIQIAHRTFFPASGSFGSVSGALMQQRQPRLGDILDDYCPRERRVTNHAVVAMVGHDVKQTRCTTCDAEHEYKHAKVPRQRRKTGSPAALYSQVLANGPKRVAHEGGPANGSEHAAPEQPPDAAVIDVEVAASGDTSPDIAAPVDPQVPPQPQAEPAIAAGGAPGAG